MFGIIDGNAKDEGLMAARKILYRERVHTVLLPPDFSPLPYPYPLRDLIILHPERLTDLGDVVARAKAAFPDLPLAIFRPNGATAADLFLYRRCADFVYDDSTGADRVIADLSNAYMARTSKAESNIVGGLHLSRSEEYATLYGFPILFTKVEWMLLYYLLQTHPRAVSAKELAAVAFWPNREISTHNVTAHLSRIRTKLHADFPDCRVIERVAGGYRLFG